MVAQQQTWGGAQLFPCGELPPGRLGSAPGSPSCGQNAQAETTENDHAWRAADRVHAQRSLTPARQASCWMAQVHNERKRKLGRKVGTGPAELPSWPRSGDAERGATYGAND
jgi:hypothetical protein